MVTLGVDCNATPEAACPSSEESDNYIEVEITFSRASSLLLLTVVSDTPQKMHITPPNSFAS